MFKLEPHKNQNQWRVFFINKQKELFDSNEDIWLNTKK